ncbi:hypothetical protein SLA2020_427950 [Shorea laevis]
MLNQRKLKHLDHGPSSQMSMTANSLNALKHSMPPLGSTIDLNVELLPFGTNESASPVLTSSPSLALYGALRKKDSFFGLPLQEVTSTQALMATPPILSRRFSRAPT